MMLRLTLAFFIALTFQAYANGGAPFGISESDVSSYSSYDFEISERHKSNTAADHFTRSGERVHLKYREGASIELQNSDGCYSETCAKHWVIGYWEQVDRFLIGVWYYEDPGTLIIGRNNERLELIGIPVHSPDAKRFVAFNDGCRVGDPEVQVGKWIGDNPEVDYESFRDSLFPHRVIDDLTISKVRWIEADAVELELSEGCDADSRTRYGLLVGKRLNNNRWSWTVRKSDK
jgi:hypothetical protein